MLKKIRKSGVRNNKIISVKLIFNTFFMYICIMKTIRKHFAEQNQEVKTCEYQFTIIGSPFFYVNKGQYIFKVELTNGEVWWIRTGVFSNDYEKDK